MTLHASGCGVRTGERERSLRGVIEGSSCPIDSGVAQLAILWESRGRVIRIRSGLIILEVTRRAGSIQRGVLAVRVAQLAADGGVCTGQGEFSSVVIELGAQPLRRVVA